MVRFTYTKILCILLLGFSVQAQIIGTILDKGTHRPVPFVSVALYSFSDSVAVSGAVTDTVGYYSIPLPDKAGKYLLKTFFVGYKAASQELTTTTRGKTSYNADTIFLEAEAKWLDEVRVQGQKMEVLMKADRQIYRARQFQAAAGGTATDVLRNLPGLTIDAAGEVSLRGTNGFLVLLNGKPVQANLGTLLNQLPANSIESIEVITTPNARFDPDGKAGIIALVTREGADNGWSAVVNGLIGLPSVGDFGNARRPQRHALDGILNYRSEQWDIALSSAYIRNDIAGRRVGDVSTTLGNRRTHFPSQGERSFDRYTLTNRLAVVYTPRKYTVWNLGFYQSQRTEDRLADIFYTNTTTNLQTGQVVGSTAYFNSNLVRKKGTFYTANLDYTHTYQNKATLSGGLLYEYDQISGFTKNRNLNQKNDQDTLQYTLSTTSRPIQNFRATLDGSKPLRGGKLAVGYQFRYQEDKGNYRYSEQDGNGQPLTLIPAFTGLTLITHTIHSMYFQYSKVVSKWDYTAGLRYEYALRQLSTIPQNKDFTLTLHNLFPSFNVLFKPREELAWRVGFSRRIQRNTNFALNPLPEREHSETLEQGDPNLLPEFVNLAEVGVSQTVGSSTLLATVYYQGIKNVINRVNNVYADTILNRIFTNAGLAQRIGADLATDLKLTSNWKLYLGGTVYRYSQQGQLFEGVVQFDRAAWVYAVNANTSVQLRPSLSLQASLNYLSRRITAQGEDSRFLTPHISLKKSMLANRLTILLQWQTIGMGFLPSNEQRITTYGRNFFTTTNYIQEKDIFQIHLNYSFRQLSKRTQLPGNEVGDKEF